MSVPVMTIPDSLRRRVQWVTWKPFAKQNGQLGKMPTPIPSRGKLREFNQAHHHKPAEGGIGFGWNSETIERERASGWLTIALDVDACVNPDGTLTEWAERLHVHFATTYTECTPSKTGLRIWLQVPADWTTQTQGGHPVPYLQGSRRRAFNGETFEPAKGTTKTAEVQLFGLASGFVTVTGDVRGSATAVNKFGDLATRELFTGLGFFTEDQTEPYEPRLATSSLEPADMSAIFNQNAHHGQPIDPAVCRAVLDADYSELRHADDSASAAHFTVCKALLAVTDGCVQTAAIFHQVGTAWGRGDVDSAEPQRYTRTRWVMPELERARKAMLPRVVDDNWFALMPNTKNTSNEQVRRETSAHHFEQHQREAIKAQQLARYLEGAHAPLPGTFKLGALPFPDRNRKRYSTGIEWLDEQLTVRGSDQRGAPLGLRAVINGAPEACKTALAVTMADAFERSGLTVLFVAIDEEPHQIRERFLQRAGVPRASAQSGDLQAQQQTQQLEARDIKGVTSTADAVQALHGLAHYDNPVAVIVDSLQAFAAGFTNTGSTEKERIDAALTLLRNSVTGGRGLYVATSEMGRHGYQHRIEKRHADPLGHGKGTSQIEFDANLLISATAIPTEIPGTARFELELAKNKQGDGPVGTSAHFLLKRESQRIEHTDKPAKTNDTTGDLPTMVRAIPNVAMFLHAQKEPVSVNQVRSAVSGKGSGFKSSAVVDALKLLVDVGAAEMVTGVRNSQRHTLKDVQKLPHVELFTPEQRKELGMPEPDFSALLPLRAQQQAETRQNGAVQVTDPDRSPPIPDDPGIG